MGFDRRQKSFGEPTRVRADGKSSAQTEDDVPRPKPANTAYERYKQELQAFFNGSKPLPDHLKDLLATRPGAAEHGLAEEAAAAEAEAQKQQQNGAANGSEKGAAKKKGNGKSDERKTRRVASGPTDEVAELVEQLRRASSPREVENAVKALREKGAPLPRDPEILSKALGCGDEGVLAEALAGLVEIDLSLIKSPTLLKTRIKNVLLLATTTDVKELGAKMMARL
jgi:hypothetical protein